MAPLTRCRSRFTMARKVSWMLFLIAVFGVGVSLSALDAPSPLNEFVRTDMAWAPPASYTLSACAFFMIHLDRRSRWHLPRRRPYCRRTTKDPTDSLDSYAVLVFISAVAVCLSLVIFDWTRSLSPVATADTEEFPSDACRTPSSLSRMDTVSAGCVIETELLRGGIESNPGPPQPDPNAAQPFYIFLENPDDAPAPAGPAAAANIEGTAPTVLNPPQQP